jgi:branched-chain amino acid transport system permease protein
MIQNIIINGLINGSIYALLAMGFSLVFGVARIVNIAHTAFYMLAAYFIYAGFQHLGMSPYAAMPISIVVVGLSGGALLQNLHQSHPGT